VLTFSFPFHSLLQLFNQVYPDLVEEFNKAEEEKKLAKKSRKRNATETGLHGGKRRPEKTPVKGQKLITDMLKKTKNKCAEKSAGQQGIESEIIDLT